MYSTPLLALLLVILLGCSQIEDKSQSVSSTAADETRVEDPQSPLVGKDAQARRTSGPTIVKRWPGSVSMQLGRGEARATIVRFEVITEAEALIGAFSTCFPASTCSARSDLDEGDCIRLEMGGEDCFLVSSSGTGHLVHVVEGSVNEAEARAGADLAEVEPSAPDGR